MKARRIAAAPVAALFAISLGVAAPGANAEPIRSAASAPSESGVIIVASINGAPGVNAPLAIGSKVSPAALRTTAARARAAAVKGTILEQPAPKTVNQELAMAAKATQADGPEALAGGDISATTAHSYMTLKQCLSKAQGTWPGGWYKSHWSWCQSLTLYIYNYLDGYVIGRGSFQATILGRGYSGSSTSTRKITVDQYVAEVNIGGSWPTGGPALKPYMSCRGIPKAKHCKVSGGNKYFQLRPGSSHHIKYTMSSSDKNTSHGSAQISVGVFTPKYTIQTTRSSATDSGFTQGFRCDSAPYFATNKACIFDRVTRTFTLRRSDREVSQAASHIRDALRKAPNVYPGKGKSIPSNLTRMTNKKAQDANRRKARASCRKKWPHRPAGKDCDEYPFASTNQGAAKAKGKYSVRYIASGQNQEAGRRLGRWFESERIMDGNHFKVKIK